MKTRAGTFDRGNVNSEPAAFVKYEFLKFDDENKGDIATTRTAELNVYVFFKLLSTI